jgi:molecular chaperone GrpE
MTSKHKPNGSGIAPGEPEAPVAPQPPAPDGPPAQTPEDWPPSQTDDGLDAPAAPDGPAPSVPAGDPEAPVGPTAPAGDPELDDVAAHARKADEYLELAQRTKADFENYRKRAARETAAAQERGVVKLARELLPAVDNLDRALESVDGDGDNGAGTLVSGIKLVHADVIGALSRAGIERFSPKGERFDPQRHEAIAQQPVDGAEPGTIVEVYQRGYVLGDFVIRPARVVVAG